MAQNILKFLFPPFFEPSLRSVSEVATRFPVRHPNKAQHRAAPDDQSADTTWLRLQIPMKRGFPSRFQ